MSIPHRTDATTTHTSMQARRAVPGLATFLTLLAACGAPSEGGHTVDSTVAIPTAAPGGETVQPDATTADTSGAGEAGADSALGVVPNGLVGAVTVDGNALATADLRGRPTVMWFWAPWCTICRGEAPHVAEIAERFAGQVNLIGIAGQGSTAEMQAFVADTGTAGITHVDDGAGSIWNEYGIYSQPAFAFVTADGRVETYLGALGEDGLAEIIDLLLEA